MALVSPGKSAFIARCIAVLLVLLVGCTEKPNIPELPSTATPNPIANLVFDDELSATDVRRLFGALNQKGELNSLRRWFDEPADEELDVIAKIASRWILQDVDEANGLWPVFNTRAEKDQFGSLHLLAQEITTNEDWLKKWRLIQFALSVPEAPGLLAAHRLFLLPEVYDPIAHAVHAAKPKVPQLQRHPLLEPIEPRAADLTAEFLRLNTVRAWSALDAHSPKDWFSFWFDTLNAFHLASRHFGRNHAIPVGLSISLFDLMRPIPVDERPLDQPEQPPHLTSLVNLLAKINQPSAGMFGTLAQKLREPGNGLSALPELFARYLTDEIARGIDESLNKRGFGQGDSFKGLASAPGEAHPNAAFTEVFQLVKKSLERVVGSLPSDATSSGAANRSIPVYLGALTITRWLEHYGQQNPLLGEIPEIEVSLRNRSANGELSWEPKFAAEMKSLFSAETQRALESLRTIETGFGTWQYQLGSTPAKPLGEALAHITSLVHEHRPLGDMETAARILLYTAPIEKLDSDNLFVSLHQLLSGVEYHSVRAAKRLALYDLGLSDPNSLVALQFLDWLPDGGKAEEILRTILSSSYVLEPFDQPHRQFPSPLESYLELIRHQTPGDYRVLGSLFTLLHESELLATRAEQLKFPSLAALLLNPNRLSKWLSIFVQLGAEVDQEIPRALANFFVHLTAERHALQRIATEDGTTAGTLILEVANLQNNGFLARLISEFSPQERRWLNEFLSSPDFLELWTFFSRHGDWRSLHALARELTALNESGQWLEALALAQQIDDPRLRKVATDLRSLTLSGAWMNLVKSLELLSVAAK